MLDPLHRLLRLMRAREIGMILMKKHEGGKSDRMYFLVNRHIEMSCMVVHVCRPTDWQFVVAEMRHVNMNKDVQVSDINVLRDWSSASRDVRENAFDQYYYFRKNTYNSSFANNISEHTHQATLLRLLSCSFSDKSPPFCLFRSFCSSAGLRSSWLPATLFPSVRKLCESPVGGVSTAFQLVSPWPPDTDGALAISSGARPSAPIELLPVPARTSVLSDEGC